MTYWFDWFLGWRSESEIPSGQAGCLGFVDFVGYSVAQPENVPLPAEPVGCLGFIDFCGIPVGVPPARVGGGIQVGGRRHTRAIAHAMIEAEKYRSVIEEAERIALRQLADRITLHELEYRAAVKQQKQAFETSVNALLLSEG